MSGSAKDGLLCGLCSGLGMIGCWLCHRKVKALEEKRDEFMSRIVPIGALAGLSGRVSGERIIVQVEVTKDVGLLHLFQQRILTKTKTVPFNSVNVGVTVHPTPVGVGATPSVGIQQGFATIDEQYLGFGRYPDTVCLTDSSFGIDGVSPSSSRVRTLYHSDSLVRGGPTDRIKGFGHDVSAQLLAKYGYRHPDELSNRHVYKAVYYGFRGRTFYLAGIYYGGGRFVYDHFGQNPQEVADYCVGTGAYELGRFLLGTVAVGALATGVMMLISKL